MQRHHYILPEEIRIQLAQLLTFDLSAATNLHAQMKQAHWNVQKGSLPAQCGAQTSPML